jgi:uncharacterized protein (TIGR03118 family)
MKNNSPLNSRPLLNSRRATRFAFPAAVLALVLTVPAVKAHDDEGAGALYTVTNLVSDIDGAAILTDTNLVNAWGISFGPTSPFWVSANGTGLSLIYSVTYDDMGDVQVAKVPLEVGIPGEGNPSGQVFNGTGAFHGDIFIFASEDGTISGWRGPLGTSAETLVSRSNAVYKGITLVKSRMGPLLLGANFAEGTVDAYDSSLNLVGQFKDPHAPAGYAPFNVRALGKDVFVTFAKQNPGTHDDLSGVGHGFIDVLDAKNGKLRRFATGSDAGGKLDAINSPWGLALAPESFGEHGGELLVGNFGNGTIMAFDRHNGHFRGLLTGTHNNPIAIDGLWGLTFGNGARAGRPETLYFSAGPDDEGHGLFGSIDPVPGNDDDRR